MLQFLKRHGSAIVLTLIALIIINAEFKAAPIGDRLVPSAFMNPFFVAMGKWGIRFLLISLAVTPLYTLTGWRTLTRIRKPAGLLAFLFVCVHVGLYVFYKDSYWDANIDLFQRLTEPSFVILGVLAFIILALMALTSIKFTMKLSGRYWKPIHRLAYGAGILMLLHSVIAASSGKRPFMGGPASVAELKIYVGILVVLLLARIPMIHDWIKDVSPFVEGRKPKQKHAPMRMESGE